MRLYGVPPVEGGQVSADIIAWLRSEEGIEWSLSQAPSVSPFYVGQTPVMRRDGLVDPAEDPCGRPPLKIAATEECG
jgi:hypothetical protein